MGVHDPKAEDKAHKAYGIPDDEPIFVIRAQDPLACGIVAQYRNAAVVAGCDEEFVKNLDTTIEDFAAFKLTNPKRMKRLPD